MPALIFGSALATGLTVGDVEEWPQRIAAVSPAQVNAAARAGFVERNATTGILLPAAERS